MQITKVKIENFRCLKKFELNIEEQENKAPFSVIVGRNNTGKTSLLTLFERFFNHKESRFKFNDLSIATQNKLSQSLLGKPLSLAEFEKCNFDISLMITIIYDPSKDKNISYLGEAILDLENDKNEVTLLCKYGISYEQYLQACNDFEKCKTEFGGKKNINDFLEMSFKNYYRLNYYKYNPYIKDIDEITKEVVSNIINFKYISARRDSYNNDANREGSNNLSQSISKFLVSKLRDGSMDLQKIEEQMIATDIELDKIYDNHAKDIKDIIKSKVKVDVKVLSSLREIMPLLSNTNLKYAIENNFLPENYNGLGNMNFISMIIDIETMLREFKYNSGNEKPAAINLLFIEEPEIHMHPQMQYEFAQIVKSLLTTGDYSLQTIISTHSAHIVSQVDFEDLKYFKEVSKNIVESLSLSDFRKDDSSDEKIFLKKYLTLNRAEVFFADKLVCIEGDTERILFPRFMQKIDNQFYQKIKSGIKIEFTPLISQNISVIEVGAYSHIFDEFIRFLGLKTLIITDIDSAQNEEKCDAEIGQYTTNASLKHFYENIIAWDKKDKKVFYSGLKNLSFTSKILGFINNMWQVSSNGLINVVYQTKEKDYHARSFEDSFININKNFLKTKFDKLDGLIIKAKSSDFDGQMTFSKSALIDKKTNFAASLLFAEDETNTWQIPSYIEEGLLWLMQ